MADDRLGREAWIRAAAHRLSVAGVGAVRVEALARDLGVTKGSFYWHFRDRADLLSALLSAWRASATESVIERVEARGGSAQARLTRLLEISTRGQADRLESALRAWGIEDREVREALAEVDARREDYVTGLLIDAGVKRSQARDRSRALYLALIGEFTWVSHGGQPSPRSVWKTLLSLSVTGAGA